MPLPIVADSYLVRLVWASSIFSRPAANDMCFHDDAGGHTGTDVYNAINAHVTANMWQNVAANGNVAKVVTTKLDGTAASVDHLTGAPAKWTGQGGTQPIPQGCVVVTLRTGFRGRSYRGRIYLPWIADINAVDGVINPTDLALQQTAWTTFMTDMKTAGFPIHVLSKKHSTSTEIASVTLQGFLRTQRRRSRK